MGSEEDDLGSTYVYKVVLIGDGAVGKTNLRRRYMGEGFLTEYVNTVGADFAYFSEEIGKDLYKWSIWDLAGQPKFSNVRPVFYAGAFGALVCFDPTREETFNNLNRWIDELVRHTHTEGTPIVLVATKMDIYDPEKHMNLERIEKYKQELIERLDDRFEVTFIETSSITGLNVRQAFANLRQSISKWVNSDD
ncbi:MAG: GTP-binding protein [Candidatus Heimdallarchaeota archaeon]|nr:GTP-binding protein [Candidatus Heimdallarchaeota archaeon]MDH5646237.1 GTP-binding protein [Candidatus Heimdallarchaeota archaeon]